MEQHSVFKETQRFRQWWLWLILIFSFLPGLLSIRNQFQSGETVGWTIWLSVLLLPLMLIGFFLLFRLDTEVRTDGIYVRFFPLAIKMKRYGWEEIEQAYIRTYSPLREYGGWGVRYGAKGKALNISGSQGLQLELKNGKRLLIGTQRPEELEQALLLTGYKR